MTELRSKIRDWRARWARQPWFRRYEGLAVAVLAWAAIGLLALPPFGRPEPSGADAVIAW